MTNDNDPKTPDGAQALPADERVALIEECRRQIDLALNDAYHRRDGFSTRRLAAFEALDRLGRLAAAPPAVVPAVTAEPAEPDKLRVRITALSEQHGSLRAAAEAVGLDVGYLSRLASGAKDNPSDETLARLGLRRSVTYFDATPPVAAAPVVPADLLEALAKGYSHCSEAHGPKGSPLCGEVWSSFEGHSDWLQRIARRLLTATPVSAAPVPVQWFPLLGTGLAIHRECLNEEQAHYQSLDRLAERGGLSPDEALAVINRTQWRHKSLREALTELVAIATKAAAPQEKP